MQRWKSKPLALPVDLARLARVDLEFSGVDPSGPSYTAFVFLNAGRLGPDAGRDHRDFAAAFSVFGYGDCWGEVGHCDITRGPVSAYDRRPEHHLTPLTVTVDVTDAVGGLADPSEIVVTVHAAWQAEERKGDVLRFSELNLLAYS
jgi:hypothetical protein